MMRQVIAISLLFIEGLYTVSSNHKSVLDIFSSLDSEIDTFDVFCQKNLCFRRCCSDNRALIEAQCKNVAKPLPFQKDLIAAVKTDDINRIRTINSHGFFCRENLFPLNFSISNISMDDNKIYVPEFKYWRDYKDYCVEYFQETNDSFSFGVLACFSGEGGQVTEVSRTGMIISMPFLLATFLVYAILPDRNLHQRALMLYVLTLCISYVLLVTVNLAVFDEPLCPIVGYLTMFFFMVSFFWINVICFDIWYTFSGGRGFVGSKRSSETRRFLLYNIYAWGVPLLHIGVVLLMQHIILPADSKHNPNVGTGKCFLNDGYPNLWYFYGEAGILIIINVILFLRTAFKIRQVKKETSMLKHSDSQRHAYEKDKQRFNLYLKLLFAMGVNWSMEVISWLVNWQTKNKYVEVWYLTDFFNAVYGVFIFFIFVFKKKTWKLLQKRYYNFVGKPHLAQTMTSSNTRTSHYSSTNYSTAETTLTDRTNGAGPEEVRLRQVS